MCGYVTAPVPLVYVDTVIVLDGCIYSDILYVSHKTYTCHILLGNCLGLHKSLILFRLFLIIHIKLYKEHRLTFVLYLENSWDLHGDIISYIGLWDLCRRSCEICKGWCNV